MAITQKDIAEQLGVSRSLVGLALTKHPRVSHAMQQRVRETAQQLGYRPNSAARALVTGRTGQILFRSFSQTSTSIHDFSQQLLLAAQQSGYSLLVGITPNVDPDMELPAADGAICLGEIPQSLLQHDFPAVSVQIDLRGRTAGQIGNTDVLQVAQEAACREAVQHLLDEGYRRVAYVSLPGMMSGYDPRYRAYDAVMKRAGCALETIGVPLSVPFGLRAATYRALEDYFHRHGFPDALFCSNDDIAIGAYRALRETGRRIPQETAVIGGDDIEESQDHNPALASVSWPFDVVAGRAWQMLAERIANPALPPRFEQIKAQFIPRASAQRLNTTNQSILVGATGELATQPS